MTGSEISKLRKKFFNHPVLQHSKIKAENGTKFTISLKYAGIEWKFEQSNKFESFIKKYNATHKIKAEKPKQKAKKKSKRK